LRRRTERSLTAELHARTTGGRLSAGRGLHAGLSAGRGLHAGLATWRGLHAWLAWRRLRSRWGIVEAWRRVEGRGLLCLGLMPDQERADRREAREACARKNTPTAGCAVHRGPFYHWSGAYMSNFRLF
jgi:hypothetical protein